MPVLDVLTIGHPLLRERSREVSREELATPELQSFVDDLVETMVASAGAGLAAPQVGRSLRICVLEVKDNPRYPHFPMIPRTVLVNPEVRALGEETFDNAEGCLSVPDLRGIVRRHAEIEVTAWDRAGAPLRIRARGLAAGVYQHEIDHLDGVLFVDRVEDPRTLATRADFDRFHRAGYLARMAPFFERTGG